jgi:dTDP-4-dehydrorhamnose 3,5-epimerase
MIFESSTIDGVWVVGLEPHRDERGSFARAFCATEFAEHGVDPTVCQANLSTNSKAGTLRGLHFQYPPAAETKVVRCVRGELLDVVVDLRPESSTFLVATSYLLSAANGLAVVVPPRVAHGFLTLEDDTEVLYLMSTFHQPYDEGGLAHDDPLLAIDWPRPIEVISARDSSFVALADQLPELLRRMAQ